MRNLHLSKFTFVITPSDLRNTRFAPKTARVIERRGRLILEVFALRNLRCESGQVADHFALSPCKQQAYKYWVYLPREFTRADQDTLSAFEITFDPEDINYGWFKDDFDAWRRSRRTYCFFVLPAQVTCVSQQQAQARYREYKKIQDAKRSDFFQKDLATLKSLAKEYLATTTLTASRTAGLTRLGSERIEYVTGSNGPGSMTLNTRSVPALATVANTVTTTGTGCYIFLSHSGERFYVGSTGNFARRARQHIAGKGEGCKEIASYMEQGHDFVMVCLPTSTREEAYDLEQKFLDKFVRSEFCFNRNPNARATEARRVSKPSCLNTDTVQVYY